MTHLSPEALAGYLDRDLTREERSQVEVHLAVCLECRAELAQVRGLELQHRRRWIRVAAPLAAAAAVVIAIVLPRQTRAPSGVRAPATTESLLEIVAPETAAEIASGVVGFTWRSAGPDASYRFTLQESDGRVVWSSTVTDTVATLPDSVALPPGRSWFWVVDALLPDGRSLSSGVQRLRTRP